MKRLSIFLFMLLIPLRFATGQTPYSSLTPVWGYDPAQEPLTPRTMLWSLDSRTLYFNVVSPDQKMKRYDVVTHQLENISIVPETIQLTAEQQSHFHARDSVGYIAPDQDTFVFVGTFPAYRFFMTGYIPTLYGVGGLKNQTFLPTRIEVSETGDIRWSDDSTTFLIQHDPDEGPLGLITYIKSTRNCSWNFCAFAEASNIISLDPNETIYDLSPDGERILYPDFSGVFRLWDVTKDATFGGAINQGTALPVENVIGAAFLPDTPNTILIVNADGIMRYDLDSQKLELANPNITSKWANWVMFSPDNRWVAVLVGDEGRVDRRQLFVLPVSPNT